MCEYSVKKAILILLAGITPVAKDGARTQSAKQPMGIEDEELATWVMETDVEPWEVSYPHHPGVGETVGMGDVSCHSHILDLLMEHRLVWLVQTRLVL